MDLTIVGIKYNENNNDYNAFYYVSDNILNSLRSDMNKDYSKIKIFFYNKYEEYKIEAS